MQSSDHPRTVDVVVLGAGAGGMTAALVAAIEGLQVVLIEKSPFVGGTTALSAGSVWIPNSHLASAGQDDPDTARTYLDAVVGKNSSSAMTEAFLTHGPEMVRYLEQHSEVRLRPYAHHPDYHPHAPGATVAGRTLEPLPFDGRTLGDDFARLRPPMPEFTILGGMMVDRRDIGHLLQLSRSATSARHALHLLARYARDRLSHPRGTRLVMGNALAGRLLASLRARQVPILTESAIDEIIFDAGAASGVSVTTPQGREIIKTRAVVVATGGFTRHPKYRRELLGEPVPEWSPVIAESCGDGIDLALGAGASLGPDRGASAFWTPVSVRRRADGTTAVFPHFVLDRGKPGLIAVDRSGRRFVNEAANYHDVGLAMRAVGITASNPCFFVCDHHFLQKYGLGMIRPGAHGLRAFLKDGYLVESGTIAVLAGKLGIDAQSLTTTVANNNRYAETGRDLELGKGEDAYAKNLGDPAHKPNPCLGPIATAPFYSIRVYPGDLGASRGILTDEAARTLDRNGAPIPGLFACGNDMHSVMGGTYPGPGITLGPAMTFGYVAARHIALSTGNR